MSHASPVITCSTLVNILTLITHLSTSHICTTLKSYVGLARTVYEHGIWPNIWWFSCQKYRIYSYKYVGLARTIYIYGLCTVLWQGNTRIYGAYLQILPTLHIYIVLANSIHTFSTWIMCLCNNAPLPWPHDTAGEPQWFDGKKDALIKDFRHYLGILKAVHSGADLQASAAAAGNRCVWLYLVWFSGVFSVV